jgi:hypothetical protein
MSNLKAAMQHMYAVIFMGPTNGDSILDPSKNHDSLNIPNYWDIFLYSIHSNTKPAWPDLRIIRSNDYAGWVAKLKVPLGDDIAAALQERGLE